MKQAKNLANKLRRDYENILNRLSDCLILKKDKSYVVIATTGASSSADGTCAWRSRDDTAHRVTFCDENKCSTQSFNYTRHALPPTLCWYDSDMAYKIFVLLKNDYKVLENENEVPENIHYLFFATGKRVKLLTLSQEIS